MQTSNTTILTRLIYFILFFLLVPRITSSQVIKIDSVTIYAPLRAVSLLDKPQAEYLSLTPAISRITFKEINKQGALTLMDAMNYIPGGFTETRGRQVKQFFSVRGQKYPYPEYAINGVWQKEFEELPYFFSASDIEEIEVVRSSAALLTGLSGLAGLINIKTREYESPETGIEMEYGTFNTLHTHISHGNKIGRFGFAAGAGFDRTSGPDTLHAAEAMTGLNARIDWQISDKIGVKANFFYLDGKREMAIALPPADQRYRDMVQSFDPYRAILSNIKVRYMPSPKITSELQIFLTHRNPLFIDEIKATESSEKDYEYGLNFIQAVTLSRSNILRFGGLFSRWTAPNGKRFYTGKRCDTETFSVVVTDEQTAGRFTFDAGLRLNRTFLNEYGAFNIEGDGALFRTVTQLNDIWEPVIVQGSFGVSLKVNEHLSAYLNTAAGQIKPRAGTLTESLLVPETELRIKADLGLVRNLPGSGKITIALFTVLQKNAIVLSGTTMVDPETGIRRELYLNRDQNQWGLEVDLKAPVIFNIVRPFFNFTLLQSRMNEDGEMIINKENPAAISSAGFYAGWKKFDLNLFFKYVSPFENDRFVPAAAGPQPLGDFLTTDFNAGYSTEGKTSARFYIRVKNLTNIRYSTVNGYPDFGRMIFVGIEFKFGKES